ncbi:dihydropteroate synthase [Prauserella rugosa]|uniref:Dihydropteroate synthase n=2 Tax=Prauserella rugosa TaxID=43354 RepID=A0A660C3P6_9PSEU|nr:dihydropteroate synthase [Prauserella rugosa]
MRFELEFRGRRIARDRALIMGIINRTPDSFYDRGATFQLDHAKRAIDQRIHDGADIIDIGGVKAGEAGDYVSTDEEIDRVIPTVEWARQQYPDLIISVDTWRHEVGQVACEAGADLLNDTWAGADPELVRVAGEFGAGYVCSHTGGLAPRTDPHRPRYSDVVQDVITEVTTAAERAVNHGVPPRGVLIDPTHDFGKNTWHSLELLRSTDRLVATGWPVLMALSNKDFIGESLGTDVDNRTEGTLAAIAIAAMAGAAVFRVHDVAMTHTTLTTVSRIYS